jgi:hypothetical protein
MKKFLVLYQWNVSSVDQMASASAEQAKAGMDAWMNWAQLAGQAIVDLGSPVGHAQHLTSPTTSMSGNGHVGGFSILQAADGDALKELLKTHPHFMAPGSTIEVYEFLPIPGM